MSAEDEEPVVVTEEMLENLRGLQRRSAFRGLLVRLSEDGRYLIWKSSEPGSTRELLTSSELIRY